MNETQGKPAAADALGTAVKVAALLAGVATAVYLLGGLVVSLRLLLDGFSIASVVTLVGQLPRNLVVTTALLDVIGPAAAVGVLAALAYLTQKRSGRCTRDPGEDGLRLRTRVLLAAIAAILLLPALAEALKAGWEPWLVVMSIGVALLVTYVVAAASWSSIRGAVREPSPRMTAAIAVGALWLGIALVPATLFAGALQYEQAQVCTSYSQLPEKKLLLIGDSGDNVLLGLNFGHEESVLSLPADKVTKTEYGDLSSLFSCPPPPGSPVGKAVAATLGGHQSEVERHLAMLLRPKLLFDSTERWRPLEVGAFLTERFGDRRHGACASREEPRPGEPCPPLSRPAGLEKRHVAFLDIDGERKNGDDFESPRPECREAAPAVDCNGGSRSVIYYQRTTHEGRWYWDYWWFFRYNDYNGSVNQCVIVCGDHEGDWEGVTVVTTASLEPEVLAVVYAAHRERVLVEAGVLPLVGLHPIVFVAEGTHASYPFPCATECRQYTTLVAAIPVTRLREEHHDGAVPWRGNRDSACEKTRCVRPLPEQGTLGEGEVPRAGGWAAWDGRWGATCHNGCSGLQRLHEPSPQSPGRQIRFRCPWAPTREAVLGPAGASLSESQQMGDTDRLLATCRAQRGGA